MKNGFHEKYDKLYILVASGINNNDKIPHKRKFKINDAEIEISPELFTHKNIIDFTGLAIQEIFQRPAKFENILNVLLKISNRPVKKNNTISHKGNLH